MKSIIKTELIERYMEENNLSKTKFCQICKISLSTFNKIMRNEMNLYVDAVFKIARILQIDVCEIFNRD